jgi:hypothetical protein
MIDSRWSDVVGGRGGGGGQLAGCFRFGVLLNSRPQALRTWRVVTDDLRVALRIADLLGGEPRSERDADRPRYEVITKASRLDVVLGGWDAVLVGMGLRQGSELVRSCDGRSQAGEGFPPPCSCPSTLAARRRAAAEGVGCEAAVCVNFRLRAECTLGSFTFFTGSWTFAEDAVKAAVALPQLDGSARAELRLDHTRYKTATGRGISWTQPRMAVLGSVL